MLLPILGDPYGTVLDSGQLRLVLDERGFSVRYYDTVLPLAPRSFARILGHRLSELHERLGAEHPKLVELKSLIAWFTTIPSDADTGIERLAGRQSQIETGRVRLLALLDEAPAVREFVEDNLRRFNAAAGDPPTFDLLDGLLAEQAYRVAYWRVAGEEINYRRFFDINELAAIRMEIPRGVRGGPHPRLPAGGRRHRDRAPGGSSGRALRARRVLPAPAGGVCPRARTSARAPLLRGGREDPGARRASAGRRGPWRGRRATSS